VIYLFQLIVITISLISERYVTRLARDKIKKSEPYALGMFIVRPLTGEKARSMFKVNVIVIRVTVVLLIASIYIIDFT